MKLDRVTITGADDSVDPADLVALSREFPFVEWGILFGTGDHRPRFPSDSWSKEFVEAIPPGQVRVAAHLCGRWIRDIVDYGRASWWTAYHWFTGAAERVQLNFHGARQHPSVVFDRVCRIQDAEPNFDLIFQCDGVNDALVRKLADQSVGSPLFDRSGGAGLLPEEWPPSWRHNYCGYAGGLGPDNVLQELERIRQVVAAPDEPIWIDMERRVRSDDDLKLDITKVRSVLEAVAPLVTIEKSAT